MKNFIEFYKEQSSDLKRNAFYIFLTYFFVLFSYPLVRSASSAFFYEHYTSDNYSMATFIGVVALMVMISINNKLQNIIGVHKLYFFTGIFTIVALLVSFFGLKSGIKEFAYAIFAIKEAYIVLLVHTCLAFTNAYFSLNQFKRLIGPIGAAGSLGGITGGLLTKSLATSQGTEFVFLISLVIIFITVCFFLLTSKAEVVGLKDLSEKTTPLEAIKGVKKYVFLIALVVALSQFVIYIADLQFNMVFEKVVIEKNSRTAYLGQFYTYINIVSLILQFLILPFLLMRVSTRSIFLFIPLLYFVLILGGLGMGVGSLFVVGGVFITMKGTDYSLFAVAKEVMYHPLLSLQKFGAKYLTDMFIYRAAKASIAFIMAQYIVRDMQILTIIQIVFLSVWIVAVVYLFREQKKINS